MKKILSFVLLLAMCLSLFAGCNQPTETPAASNLENAKARLFNMYKPASKDEVPAKSNDFEVVTGILVDGVSYAVEWTVTVTKGAADAVKIVDGSSAAYKKVDLTEKPEENVEFTLTATIKDGDKTANVSFNYITPAVAAPSADKIVLGYPEANSYITGAHYLYKDKNKWELCLSENKAEALALTVVDNGDDTVSFVADGGYYLFCDATNVMFVTEQSDNTKFVLEPANAEGGYFIKCAIANYNGKAQYLEVYSGYLTCYGMGTNTAIYTFTMDKAENAAGTISGLDTAPADPTDPPATETPTTQAPATQAPATQTPATQAPSTGTSDVVTTPAVGTAYKMVINQKNKGQTLYFIGEAMLPNQPWYMKSSEDIANAMSVYLESAEGGYRLYFTINGEKTYLVMYKDGTHYSLKLTTTPSTVYTWNSQYNTLVAMNEDAECYIGTYGTYTTFSCSKLEKIADSFPAYFIPA